MPASDFLAAAVGAVLGLLVGVLVAIPLSYLPWYLGSFLPIAASLALAYLGVTAVLTHKKELLQLVRGTVTSRPRDGRRGDRSAGQPVVVDTSSIIDGRIADICQTGFCPGRCWCPASCCASSQHIADSSDAMQACTRSPRPRDPQQAPEGCHRPARDPRG